MADVSVRPARVTDADAAARAQLASWAEDGALPPGALAAASVSDLAEAWTEAILRPPSPQAPRAGRGRSRRRGRGRGHRSA